MEKCQNLMQSLENGDGISSDLYQRMERQIGTFQIADLRSISSSIQATNRHFQVYREKCSDKNAQVKMPREKCPGKSAQGKVPREPPGNEIYDAVYYLMQPRRMRYTT